MISSNCRFVMFLLQTFFCEKSSFNLCIEKCKNIKILSKCEFQRAELYNLRLISKSFLLLLDYRI